jgi:hypothetical protein
MEKIMNEKIIEMILNAALNQPTAQKEKSEFPMIGKHVIIRTYSAGCWFGVLSQKDGTEVILADARRMFYWKSAGGSISLSGCAVHGVVEDESKIVEPVGSVWLDAIEITPCSDVAIKSLSGAKNVKAK